MRRKAGGVVRSVLRVLLFLAVLALVTAPSPVRTAGPKDMKSRLVDAHWLHKNRDNPALVIIDASKTTDYLKGHIPGAASASFPADRYLSYGVDTSYGGGVDFLTDNAQRIPFQDGRIGPVEGGIRRMGVNRDSVVVIYDKGGDVLATRLFWILNYAGHTEVFILDGGLSKWVEKGYPVTREIAQPKRGDFSAAFPHPSLLARTDNVLAALERQDAVLVSGSLPSRYYGVEKSYTGFGHIPLSVNVPYRECFNKDGTWKSKEELRAVFDAAGVTPHKEVVTYSGGGIAGSTLFFTLKYVLGYNVVRYYQGGILAWLDDPRGFSLWTFDRRHHLRDTEWLHWWAGERIQALMPEPKVRAVDVRPRKVHRAGHIRYSVNIPVEEYVTGQPRPIDTAMWQEVLGKNGIARDTEVVIYDDQVSPRATTLFWLLDYFAHGKTAVYTDGLKGWAAAGYKMTGDETIVAAPKTTFDVAVRPAQYFIHPGRLDKKVRITDPKDPSGKLPRIWLVASEGEPRNIPVREFKQVSWRENLGKDGRLKSAGELWTLYERAGVPKFSEIVCYSDSVPEATFNYFVLKTLGFPSVRVYWPETPGN